MFLHSGHTLGASLLVGTVEQWLSTWLCLESPEKPQMLLSPGSQLLYVRDGIDFRCDLGCRCL